MHFKHQCFFSLEKKITKKTPSGPLSLAQYITVLFFFFFRFAIQVYICIQDLARFCAFPVISVLSSMKGKAETEAKYLRWLLANLCHKQHAQSHHLKLCT